jgi:RNA polymerase sigma-70 factor (ECF subfamily)
MADDVSRLEAPDDSEAELESLMQRYQQADSTAATLLAERLSGKLYRYFLAQVREPALAEDLLQDSWLRIHKSRHTYRPGEPLLPWVFAIARRVQVDRYRKNKRIGRHEVQKDFVEDIPAVAPQKSPTDALPDLAELLKTLPPQQRETVLLLKVSGLSLEEVSRATGVSVGAVKQRAHRAYENLRRLFGGGR